MHSRNAIDSSSSARSVSDVSRSTIEHLQEIGIDSEHVGNLGMAAATDEEILDEARKKAAVVVTLDSGH